MTVTFTNAATGENFGSVQVDPTSINIPNQMWWLINKMFPTGLFPYLDPSITYSQFKKLPPTVSIRDIGQVRVYKS